MKSPARPQQQQRSIKPNLKRILLALDRYLEKHGQGPTATELAVILDLSESSTSKGLAMLAAHGYTRRSRAHRDIEITTKGQEALSK